MTATIVKNEIVVRYTSRPEINREYLEVDCPEGWDDVKKLTRKVLRCDNKNFVWTGWNSDRNVSYFTRCTIKGADIKTATIL